MKKLIALTLIANLFSTNLFARTDEELGYRATEQYDGTRRPTGAPGAPSAYLPVPRGTEATGSMQSRFLGEYLQSAQCVCSGVTYTYDDGRERNSDGTYVERETREREVSCTWQPGKKIHRFELTQPYRITNREAYAKAKAGSAALGTGIGLGLVAAAGTGVISGLLARYVFKVRNPAAAVLGLALGAAAGVATGIFSGKSAKGSAYESALQDPETGVVKQQASKTVGIFDEHPPIFSRCFNLGFPTY